MKQRIKISGRALDNARERGHAPGDIASAAKGGVHLFHARYLDDEIAPCQHTN